MQDTHRESTIVPEEPPAEEENEDENDEDKEDGEEEEEEVDEDGNPIVKKVPKIIEPPKKDKSGRISSAQDTMIELEP